jgi:PIN domain nuclease of toxin-antitoxin system
VGRNEVILLDTHAMIWFASEKGLGRQSERMVENALADDRLGISAISFWEMAMLIAKRRLRAITSAGEKRAKLLAGGLREFPLTGDIAVLAGELEGLHGDPADRIIAATAITHGAVLITADANLLRWRHRLKRQNADE